VPNFFIQGENNENKEPAQKVFAGMTEDVRQRTENKNGAEAPV
jgi:hypothetical protein